MVLNALPQEDLARTRQASLDILERIGFNLQHEGARDLLAQRGCSVKGERVRIPAHVMEGMLKDVPRSFYLYGRRLGHPVHYGGPEVHFRPSGGLPYLFDLNTGERRSPRLQDAQELVRLLDALPNFHVTNSIVYPKDIPPEMVSVASFVNTCQFSDKPNDATVVSAPEVRAIARAAAAIRGGERELREKPLTTIYVSPTSPLSWAYEQADAVLETARVGIPLVVLPCPIAGVSSPLTVAGTLAQHTAEVLSGIAIAYLINPGLPVISGIRVTVANMHSGASMLGGPETGLSCAAAVQLAHDFGFPANGYGLAASSKTSDAQIGFEKALSGLMAAEAGCDLLSGGGVLEDALSMSFEQLVMDDEIISMIFRFLRGIKVSQDTLGLEALERVMEGGSFLSESHTRRHFRAGELWQARLVDRQLFHEWQSTGSRRIEERAAETARSLLEKHQVEPLPAEVQREIDAILAAAERELVV